MNTHKSDKVAKVLLAAAGIGVSTFLIVRYHKQIFNKFTKAKNLVLYDFAKLQRKSFDVHIVNGANDCARYVKTLEDHCKEFNVLGFDCEWVTVNNERRKVALIQLCSGEGYCVLFRVCKFSTIPLELRMILENPEIIKIGVSCNEDAKNLMNDYSIKMNGAFDLRFLAILASHKAEGLAKLSKSILNIELDKNWRITCSDWEITELSKEQIDYAAKDAFVAVEIFKKLYAKVRPYSNTPSSILQFCDKYTDISFKNKLAQMNLDPVNENNENKLLSYSKKQKDINKILKRSYTTRTTPLYDNCLLLAPDGELLCTCDKKKAEWYIWKNLATEVTREPSLTVRLNFEPAGRAVGETGEYYQTARANRCCVCGKEQDLIRKNVVPHEYRKFFPPVMKDKTSHDVLLLCVQCHQMSNISDIKIRKMLEEKCNAPLKNLPLNDDDMRNFRVVQRAAKALLVDISKIPENRVAELKEVVQKAYPNDELTDDLLREIMQQRAPDAIHNSSHSKIVVDYYKSHEGIIALEKLFRQHFLDAMQPKFMPKLWDVNHNASRLEIRAMENRVKPEDLKVAGVDEKIIQNMQPSIVISQVETNNNSVENGESNSVKEDNVEVKDNNNVKTDNNSVKGDDEFDNMSMASFYSVAAGSTKMDQTDDERYFSDSATIASFYETIRSDNSTSDLTEFQSFQNSRENLDELDDSDASTIGSPDFPLSDDDDDTEVEEEIIAKKIL
ncbi:hypothetical protein PVAND_013005 [Polypedilum vanderplanki]|uniref:Exonuclease 3'-5' domain-containing protein 2 n=1 Tax=Polypedilum vanderplanki TaxID=319348 RepID=A0A9J6CPB4_POLVA|nr:hypothetical protein PVAND_013005 [Polypedilum vanderplanki]